MRRTAITQLQKKLKYWQKMLKLSDWTIGIKYAKESNMLDGNTTAQLDHCSPCEKVANILIYERYYTHVGFGISWNLDQLILHELIHVHLYEKSELLPQGVKESPKVVEFEEFVCNSLARIIFDLSTSRKDFRDQSTSK